MDAKHPPFIPPKSMSLPEYWWSLLSDPATYRLATMALDMCSIPAMSSECERVFSQAKFLITGQRIRLKADRNPWYWKTPTELYNFYDVEDAVQAVWELFGWYCRLSGQIYTPIPPIQPTSPSIQGCIFISPLLPFQDDSTNSPRQRLILRLERKSFSLPIGCLSFIL